MVARRISQMLAPRPASLRPRSAGTREKTDSGAFEVSQAGGIRGFSTGNDQNRLGVWATGSYSWLRTGQQAKSRLAAGVVGADWRRDALVAGMAVSLEQVDSKTIFNAGALDKNGVGFTPYVAYALFDDRLVLDVMGGYAFANNETSSTLFFNTTGDYASERVMAGTHATWTEILDNWSLGGKAGFLWSREKSDGYQNSLGIQQASSASRLGTLSLGGRVGYAIGAFEPYASVTYLNDVIMTKSDIGIAGHPAQRPGRGGRSGGPWLGSPGQPDGQRRSHPRFLARQDPQQDGQPQLPDGILILGTLSRIIRPRASGGRAPENQLIKDLSCQTITHEAQRRCSYAKYSLDRRDWMV